MWVQWVHIYYGQQRSVWGVTVSQASWVIRNILKAYKYFEQVGIRENEVIGWERAVKQLLVTDPSSTYYIVEDNERIRTLQCLFSNSFKVINVYVLDVHELRVFAPNIIHHTESYPVDVEAAIDCDFSDSDNVLSDVEEDSNYEMLQCYEHEKTRLVTDGFEKFKKLELGMTFKTLNEARQGLLDVVANVLPEAHHRLCMRHIEVNRCKKWRSGKEKILMWWCAWSTYEEEFKDTLNVLGKVDKDSTKDLLHFPPKEIRVKVMNMLVKNEEMPMNWPTNISPTAIKLYNDYRLMATTCTIEFNGDYGYEDHEGGESSQEGSKKISSQRSRSHVGQSSTQSANVGYETEVATQQSQTQQSTAYGPDIGNEEDPLLRPMVKNAFEEPIYDG
ncbi:hypothetical protein HAX54_000569 [Datura stramonium]|uniref:Protein FAR1-RELATED SEQUENCE n=1 Tax=Datura stramonium TaxID=4076 RepID=A0ABS8T2C1_DATST|nr:hypothetical protein [Datura stramonium]